MTLSRELQVAARRFADQTSGRIADAAGTKQVLATVATVTPGAALGGTALVTVSWRGQELVAAGYASSYTPVVGHRVVCDYIDSQLIVAFNVVGQP